MLVVLQWAGDPKALTGLRRPVRRLFSLFNYVPLMQSKMIVSQLRRRARKCSFPLHPRLAAVMIRAQELGTLNLVLRFVRLCRRRRTNRAPGPSSANSDFEIPRGQLPAHLERSCRQIAKKENYAEKQTA